MRERVRAVELELFMDDSSRDSTAPPCTGYVQLLPI